MSSDMIQIRWHGRGGQGAITAAKIVAEAAFTSGFSGVIMAPTFGTERRGAPVHTSLKISKTKIYDLSPIESPDIVVVLDHLIMDEVDVLAGLKKGGLLVLNTPRNLNSHSANGHRLAVANVTDLAQQAGLKKGIVNTGIIGALARATNMVHMDILAESIEREFEGKKPAENTRAAILTYENTQVSDLANA